MKNQVIIFILFIFVSSINVSYAKQQDVIEPGGFVHVVFFWLKDADDTAQRTEFEQHLTQFINASEYVKSKHIGTMVPSPRVEVVDNSYHYSLIVTFDSAADQDKYQAEPAHLKFIKDAAHLWEKVRVYDSLSIL